MKKPSRLALGGGGGGGVILKNWFSAGETGGGWGAFMVCAEPGMGGGVRCAGRPGMAGGALGSIMGGGATGAFSVGVYSGSELMQLGYSSLPGRRCRA